MLDQHAINNNCRGTCPCCVGCLQCLLRTCTNIATCCTRVIAQRIFETLLIVACIVLFLVWIYERLLRAPDEFVDWASRRMFRGPL
jgi:hypothetical protein